jgi:hypothetical protein
LNIQNSEHPVDLAHQVILRVDPLDGCGNWLFHPKPFKWTKSADQFLASVKRFCHKAQQTLCGEL